MPHNTQDEMMIITPDDYHQDTSRVSKSGLDLIEQSPLHYWQRYLNPDREPQEETPALSFGSLLHCVVLEPDEVKHRYIVEPEDAPKRPTASQLRAAKPSPDAVHAIGWWKEWLEKAGNRKVVSAKDMNKAQRMSDALRDHPMFSLLMEAGTAEQRVDWEDPWTGAPCKLKYDFLSDYGFFVDVKTTEDASPSAFARSVASYRYYVQAAFYMDGFRNALGTPVNGFIFAAVEKSAPYGVMLHTLDDDAIAAGRRAYQRNLETYMACIKSGEWPGYSTSINQLSLPKWAINNL